MVFRKACAVAFVATTLLAAEAAVAASQQMQWLCNRAGGRVIDRQMIDYYGESLAIQGTYGYIGNKVGIWQLMVHGASDGLLERQRRQQERMQEIARSAYLTRVPVNLCTDVNVSPNAVWIIEMVRP